MAGARRVPNDPQRRGRIVVAAQAVIAAEGVRRLTFRRVALEAGIPLGSVSYYFPDLEALIEEVFADFAERISQRYRAALEGVSTQDEACEAIASLICGDQYATREELTFSFEMYSYGSHSAVVAGTTREGLLRGRGILCQYFSEPASRAIDALIEAWPMHQAFEEVPLERSTVAKAVRALAST